MRVPDIGAPSYPLDDGLQVLWLRLTPPLSQPLAPVAGTAEIIVTGTAERTRAAIPIQPAENRSQ